MPATASHSREVEEMDKEGIPMLGTETAHPAGAHKGGKKKNTR